MVRRCVGYVCCGVAQPAHRVKDKRLRRAFGIFDAARWKCLECVSKIPEYAISGVAAPFLRHKARLSAAKLSGFFLELTQNPLELANCSA